MARQVARETKRSTFDSLCLANGSATGYVFDVNGLLPCRSQSEIGRMESSRAHETRFEHAYHPILLLTRVHTFELHLDPVQRTGCCFIRVSLHNHVMHNLILTNLLRPLVRVQIDTRSRLMNSLSSNQMSESSLARFSSSESMCSR